MRAAIVLFVVSCVVMTGCLPESQVSGAPKPASKTEAFTGIWIPQSSIAQGQEQLPEKASREMIRLSIVNDEYKMYLLTDAVKLEGRLLAAADFSIDEKAGTFELAFKDGLKKGEKMHGIYELSKTTLKICYAPTDKVRPTKFEAPAGSDAFCDIWERTKK